jgi:uroporphyrinogen decarboxylase
MTIVQSKPLVEVMSGRKSDRYPVWFMRQAGRYLPEYREVRSKVSFLELCQSPKLAAEVTIQPLRRYDLDAAIIFSDILVPCTALGMDFSIDSGHGPHLAPVTRTEKDLLSLNADPDVEKTLGYVGEAIELCKKQLGPRQAMIGFAGAPFTVASYMIEGGPSKNFTEVKRLIFQQPELFHKILEVLNHVTFKYLEMQKKAGADVLMLFDSWAAQLSGEDYKKHVFPQTADLLKRLRSLACPIVYYPGQGSHLLHELSGLSVDVISVDWRVNLGLAHQILEKFIPTCALQGNLDPQYLIAEEAFVREKTRAVLAAAKTTGRSHVFNVGHGLLPHTPEKSLSWVIDEIRTWGK